MFDVRSFFPFAFGVQETSSNVLKNIQVQFSPASISSVMNKKGTHAMMEAVTSAKG